MDMVLCEKGGAAPVRHLHTCHMCEKGELQSAPATWLKTGALCWAGVLCRHLTCCKNAVMTRFLCVWDFISLCMLHVLPCWLKEKNKTAGDTLLGVEEDRCEEARIGEETVVPSLATQAAFCLYVPCLETVTGTCILWASYRIVLYRILSYPILPYLMQLRLSSIALWDGIMGYLLLVPWQNSSCC